VPSLLSFFGAPPVREGPTGQRAFCCTFRTFNALVRNGLWRDGKAVDAEVIADAVDDKKGPSKVHHDGEDEVGSQVP